MPHARVMVHQPLIGGSGISGQVSDIEIEAEEASFTKKALTDIYARHTGYQVEKLTKLMDRNNYMGPETAKKFNIVDRIVENRKKKKPSEQKK